MFWAVKGRCENELGLPQLLLPLQLKVQRILELFGSPVLTENPLAGHPPVTGSTREWWARLRGLERWESY